MKKIAVITGASSGMGRDFVFAVDREFRPEEIWVIARREERLLDLQSKTHAKIVPFAMDLSDAASFSRYEAALKKENPQIEALVNAAGYGKFCTFRQMELSEQLGIVDLNARALTAMCHISIPYMTRGSKIVNLGSNSSWQPVPYMSVYGASKAYVLSFSRALGRELKKDGIGVLCVCPGWVKTEFMDRAVRDNTISFFDRWYESKDVVDRAMRDLRRGKSVSILDFPVRMQVRLVKHLPVDTVMNVWCKQQKK